jgi:exocyst complex component 3
MAEQFLRLSRQVKRTRHFLEEDIANLTGPQPNMLLVHYQLQLLEKFRNDTMVQARGASVELLSLLSNLFKKVDNLEALFDKHLWHLTSRIIDILKAKQKSTIVRLIKIIETEEYLDETAANLDTDTQPMDLDIKSVEMEFTRGRTVFL